LHLAFVFVALVLAVRWAQEALPRYLPKDWARAHEFDAFEYWGAARLFLRSINPYSKQGLEAMHTAFGHPPTAVFWVLPIARLDKPIAAELMALSAWLLLALHLYVCAREIRFPAPIALTILLFAWSLTTQGFVMHWHAIQSSEQIAFALVVAWVYLRRGREWPAGVALGVAACFKIFPAIIYLLLLLARRFRAFVAACLTLGLAVAIVTARFGIDVWQEFLVQQKPVANMWLGSVRNGSLHGAILRLLSPVCVSAPVPSSKASLIATAISILLLAGATFASLGVLRRARQEDPRAIDVPFALFTSIAVFTNVWVWEHYWVLLIQPAFVVAKTLYVKLRDTLNGWFEETTTNRALAVTTLASAVGAVGILTVAKLLQTQSIRTESLLAEYYATKSVWSHRQLHLYEVFNTAPWVIMIVLCFIAVAFAAPTRSRGR
jgi:hypothetical protein